MKTANLKFSRILACALVFLLALTAAVPVFADTERPNVNQDNLQVVIHNNEGLPAMSATQFTVYQLFTGTPHKEKDQTNKEYGADNWNNYTLADVEWGASIKGKLDKSDPSYLEGQIEDYDYSKLLLQTLQGLKSDSAAWAFDAEGTNVFAGVKTAADLAKVLENHNTNDFMQHFATIVGGLNIKAVNPTVSLNSDSTNHAKDYLTYTFTEPGYYMFADTHKLSTTEADARSEYIIAVLGDQEINLKASVPTVDKDIVVGIDDKKSDAAGVGDYVQFKLTGTLPQNYDDFDVYKYIFHDTLSKGLEYVQGDTAHPLEIRVYANEAEANADVMHNGGTLIDVNNYTVLTEGSENPGPKCNLEISFKDLKTLSNAVSGKITVTSESVFVVTYYAKVTKDAVLLSDGNPNTVLLEYSNDPNHDGTGKTKEKTVYVYAFGLDLKKIGSDKPEGLGEAGFVLKDKDGNYAIFEDQWVNNDGTDFATTKDDTHPTEVRRLIGWTSATSVPSTNDVKKLIEDYHTAKEAFDKAPKNQQSSPDGSAYTDLADAKEKLENYLLESGADGAIPDVYGLDAGDYNLEEVIVPDGYNSPENDFDIGIQAKVNGEDGSLESVTYKHGTEQVVYKNSYTTDEQSALPSGETADNLIHHFKSGLVQDSIENQKAPFLPFTGGIGTLIFYVLGIALIAGAVTYLVIASKKRKKAEENA